MPKIDVAAEIDSEDIKDDIQDYYEPEDIFDEDRLKRWAEDNGYVPEEV